MIGRANRSGRMWTSRFSVNSDRKSSALLLVQRVEAFGLKIWQNKLRPALNVTTDAAYGGRSESRSREGWESGLTGAKRTQNGAESGP